MWQELLNIFQQKDVLVRTQTRVASLPFFGLYCINHNLYIYKSNFKLLISVTCNHLFNWSPFIQLTTDMEITEKLVAGKKAQRLGEWGEGFTSKPMTYIMFYLTMILNPVFGTAQQ